MFGVDYVIDENLKLYIVEINASPMVVGTSNLKTKLMIRMMKDLFNIIYA